MYTLLILLFLSLSQSQYVGPGSGGDQHPTGGARIDDGCHIDPNGGCIGGLASGDNGSEMDPNGVRVTGGGGDAGPRMDDNG